MDRLDRGHDLTRERYQTLLKQYEDARLASTLEQSKDLEEFRILDAAVPPAKPMAPDRFLLLLMAAAASRGSSRSRAR